MDGYSVYCDLMIVGSVSMFFLGLFTVSTNIPASKEFYNLRVLKIYFSIILFTLSIGLFISYLTGYDIILDKLSTISVASVQALFCTAFIRILMFPLRHLRKFTTINILVITFFLIVLYTIVLNNELYAQLLLYIASVVYIFLCIYYVYCLIVDYKSFVKEVDGFYEEDLSYKSTWLRWLFFGFVGIGFMALLTIFFGVYYYMLFIPTFIIFYTYMSYKFSNYIQSMAYIFPAMRNIASNNKGNDQSNHALLTEQECEVIHKMVEEWIANKGYLVETVSADSLSKQWGIDVFHLREVIKKKYGEDFRTLRIRKRIEIAKEMIDLRPGISLSAVREACGIEDRSNFHKHFIRFVGVSPTEYKIQKGVK